jgi:hypothetical protein
MEKKYPLHGKMAQVRIRDGKPENENDIVEMEYNEIKKKSSPFKKICQTVKRKK